MLHQTKDGITLAVRAQPGAKRTAIAGIYGEGPAARLKIAVNAPPSEGRANEALIAYLAKLLSLPKNAVMLTAGVSSRSKVFLLHGISLATTEAVIAACLQS